MSVSLTKGAKMRAHPIFAHMPKNATHIRYLGAGQMAGGAYNIRVEYFKQEESGNWLVFASDSDNEYEHWKAIGRRYKKPEEVLASLVPIESAGDATPKNVKRERAVAACLAALRFYATGAKYSSSWLTGDPQHIMEERGRQARTAIALFDEVATQEDRDRIAQVQARIELYGDLNV